MLVGWWVVAALYLFLCGSVRWNSAVSLWLLVVEVLSYLDTDEHQFNTSHTKKHNKTAEFHLINNSTVNMSNQHIAWYDT
jgi:hypothetical protein